ncbi:MAG: flippase [Candidatus Omnitrophica bacterium]|nr:flippase [Candidatus Omnitrophota bacterium]
MKEDQTYDADLSKIAKNASISGIGEVVFNVFGYITNIVMTRHVGPAIFGIFNLANIITWIAQIFSSFGLNDGLLRFVAFYKAKGDTQRLKGTIIFGTKITLSLSLLLTGIIFFYADYIAVRFFHDSSLELPLKVLIISLPFLTLGELWLRVIQSFQVIKYQIYIQKFYQPVVKLVVLISLFLIGMKLGGILIASIISILTGFFFSLFYLVKIFPVHKKLPEPVYEKKEIIAFSLPLSLNQFFGVLTFYIDSLMLGYFKTASDVGIYNAVGRVAILILLPLSSFNTIFAPMISEIYSKNEMGKLEELFKTTTKWVFILSFPVFLLCILLAEPIMGIFGQGFAAGAVALMILGGGELVNAGSGSVGYMLMMTGRSRIVLLNSIIFCFSNIGLNYVLIPQYGIIGAATATGLSLAAINILRLIEVYLFLGFHPYKLDYLKPCIAGLLSSLIVAPIIYNLASIHLVATAFLALLFVVLYSIFIYLFKLDKDDTYILQLIYRKLLNVSKA